MRVVLDASAAIAATKQGERGRLFQKFLDKADLIEVPELFIPETANAVWKYHFAGHLSRESAEALLERVMEMPDEFVSGSSLFQEAFAMAAGGKRAAYDIFYLALARRHNATLLTTDKGLAAFATKHDVKVFSPK